MSCKALSALRLGKLKQINDKAKHESDNDDGGYLRERRGLVLWIWMSQFGQALLVSTCRMMHDLQTEHTEVTKLTRKDLKNMKKYTHTSEGIPRQ